MIFSAPTDAEISLPFLSKTSSKGSKEMSAQVDMDGFSHEAAFDPTKANVPVFLPRKTNRVTMAEHRD